MRSTLLPSLVLGVCFLAAVEASAAGMKCEHAWVSAGESTYKVKQKCGEPNGEGTIVFNRGIVKEVYYYEVDGATYTLRIVNNRVESITMSRF